MSNIFSNRFFQGIMAITAITLAVFSYQHFTGDTTITDTTATTEVDNSNSITNTATTAATEDKTENAVNNTAGSDNINTAAGETTSE